MQFKHFIGIDVSKETLDICQLSDNQVAREEKIKNNRKTVKQLLKTLVTAGVDIKQTLWCLEHTGVYTAPALEVLYAAGAFVWLENPMQIKLSQGMTRSKDDKTDARRIATYAYTFREKARKWEPKRQVLVTLKQLMRLRAQLVEAKAGIAKSIADVKRFLPKETSRIMEQSTRASLKKMQEDIVAIEEQMKNLINSDQNLKHLFKLVTSVDGIGLQTALAMIITTNEFRDFQDSKKYCCYAGVAPFQQQSGKSLRTKARVSQKANKDVKKLLHMAALTVLKIPGSEFASYYQRKKQEGKNGMTILNAIRAKLVTRVFSCIKNQRCYTRENPYDLNAA